MNRIIIIILMIVLIFLGGSFSGYKVASAKFEKSKNKVVAALIKDNNEDKKVIQKKVIETKKTKAAATREIIKIKEVIVTVDCPLIDIVQLHNEAITRTPANLYLH